MIRRTKQLALVLGMALIAAFSVKSGVEASQHDSHEHSHAPATAKKLKNPLQATEENIAAGKTLYAKSAPPATARTAKPRPTWPLN